MSKAFIILGAFGDIAQVLPILYHEFQATGQKQNLIVSKNYASICDGCSYVEPHVFEGNHGEIRQAIKWSKSKFSGVVVLQTHGIDFPVEHRTPSFQTDAWLRAGCIEHFGEWPLVFDSRDVEREAQLSEKVCGKKKEKIILLADHSQSSPFPQIEELNSMLVQNFPDHKIIRLSEVKSDRIYDLISLYDLSDALVTIDTAHLHLSLASDVPIAAFSADGWRGSANSERFSFYCKYGDWNNRKGELVNDLKLAMTTKKEALDVSDVSVIIPVFKPPVKRLNRCLESVLNQCGEIIVTCDESGQIPAGALQHEKIQYGIAQGIDIGFGRNVNSGVAKSKGKYLLILNDDVFLFHNAVRKLKSLMKDNVGIIGHLLRFEDYRIQFGGRLRHKNSSQIEFLDLGKKESSINGVIECELLTAASMLIKREAFERVKGFDSDFQFYCEDNALCMSVRQLGYKILFTPDAMGIHLQHASTSKRADFQKLVRDSGELFGKKWGWYFEKNKNLAPIGVF